MLYQNMRRFALNNFPRNQFGSNPTRVRIPPAAPKRSVYKRFAPFVGFSFLPDLPQFDRQFSPEMA